METTNQFTNRVFISAPMSAYDEKSYIDSRNEVMNVVSFVRNHYRQTNVYFAGEDIHSKKQFSSGKEALKNDTDALRESGLFIMIYPVKIVSSALIEAGFALALGIPIIVFVKDSSDLPYLLKCAGEHPKLNNLPPIFIKKYKSTEDICSYLASSDELLLLNQTTLN